MVYYLLFFKFKIEKIERIIQVQYVGLQQSYKYASLMLNTLFIRPPFVWYIQGL